MDIPAALQADLIGFVKSAIETCEKALKAINELDELLETGADDIAETPEKLRQILAAFPAGA